MRLSIIIPVYNERATVEELVARVVAVKLEMDREIIVVDDGSTDGTRDIYPKIVERWPQERIQVRLQSENKGKGAAVREGFAPATARSRILDHAAPAALLAAMDAYVEN